MYKVLSVFDCYNKIMVTVAMPAAVCVMTKAEYDHINDRERQYKMERGIKNHGS